MVLLPLFTVQVSNFIIVFLQLTRYLIYVKASFMLLNLLLSSEILSTLSKLPRLLFILLKTSSLPQGEVL